jgi:Pregnancy-associated plasma protein-A
MHEVRRRSAPWRVAVLLALAVAAYSAITVTPAVAATNGHGTSACESTVFDGLSGLGSAAAFARGGVAREPSLNQVVADLPARAKGKAAARFTSATVPVYFHVVHANGVGNVPMSVINDQMNVLNSAFAGFFGGAASGFSFTLAGVTRTNNAEWHNAKINSHAEREMKKALHQGGWNALNLYAVTADVYLGWAYFPGLSESRQYLDGVIVDWESMPGASDRYEGVFDLGHTATHEVGHWLNLHHTFNGGCNNWGDYVEDTPPMKVPTGGCPEGKDTCREPGLDPIHNYMDYSDDPCYNQFTAGQVQRMQDSWLEFRA